MRKQDIKIGGVYFSTYGRKARVDNLYKGDYSGHRRPTLWNVTYLDVIDDQPMRRGMLSSIEIKKVWNSDDLKERLVIERHSTMRTMRTIGERAAALMGLDLDIDEEIVTTGYGAGTVKILIGYDEVMRRVYEGAPWKSLGREELEALEAWAKEYY